MKPGETATLATIGYRIELNDCEQWLTYRYGYDDIERARKALAEQRAKLPGRTLRLVQVTTIEEEIQ